jgi:hypothetical protein
VRKSASRGRSVSPLTFVSRHLTYLSVRTTLTCSIEKRFTPMSSQEELAGCLRQLMEALAPNHARRLSIVRDGDKPRAACAEGHAERDKEVVTAPRPALL